MRVASDTPPIFPAMERTRPQPTPRCWRGSAPGSAWPWRAPSRWWRTSAPASRRCCTSSTPSWGARSGSGSPARPAPASRRSPRSWRRQYRARGERVGIVAVDPTSPFTGGALLGDRIRMNDLATDPGVFIRSMATRGSLGGLATTTKEVADVMDAFGFERVLTETVGVGQTELEIAETADTTVVVLVPESGDSIQAMKAGLMEIADVFVINKADRPGADRLAQELEVMLHMRLGEARSAGGGPPRREPALGGAARRASGRRRGGGGGGVGDPGAARPWRRRGGRRGAGGDPGRGTRVPRGERRAGAPPPAPAGGAGAGRGGRASSGAWRGSAAAGARSWRRPCRPWRRATETPYSVAARIVRALGPGNRQRDETSP